MKIVTNVLACNKFFWQKPRFCHMDVKFGICLNKFKVTFFLARMDIYVWFKMVCENCAETVALSPSVVGSYVHGDIQCTSAAECLPVLADKWAE